MQVGNLKCVPMQKWRTNAAKRLSALQRSRLRTNAPNAPNAALRCNAKLFFLMCKCFGFPQILHFDRGPHFYNQDCLEWVEKMDVKWVFGSRGQAKGQGKIERAIRSVKT